MKRYSYLVPALIESLLGLAASFAAALVLVAVCTGGPR